MAVADLLKNIRIYIEQMVREKFTGELVFRLRFNQGGVRDGKITVERSL